MATRPRPDLHAEEDVDFGRYWSSLAARWWLAVAGVVAGAVIGYLASLGGSDTFRATAQVYLGQPYAPGSATPVGSVPTQLALVQNMITADATVADVANKVGLRPNKLRDGISSKPINGVTGAKVGTPAPLLEITVEGSPRDKIAAAANALALRTVKFVSTYTGVRISTLEQHLQFDRSELKALNVRAAAAFAQQQALLKDKSLDNATRLIGLSGANSILVFSDQRRSSLESDIFTLQQQLTLANEVELPKVVVPAISVKTPPPSKRTGAIIGAFIGLIIGIAAALLWTPISRRFRARPS